MARGSSPGERRGGRQKGTLNKRTLEVDEIRRKAVERGITPLDVMLEVMWKCYEDGDLKGAHEAAKDAAPYMHPRLNSINATVDQHTIFTLEDTDNTEWLIRQLDRLEAVEPDAREADRVASLGNSGTTH